MSLRTISEEAISELSKSIVIKEVKIKNKNKTYISGLDAIEGFNTKKIVEKFATLLKVKFGCGCKVEPDETNNEKFVLIFQGNHKEKITSFIKEKYPTVRFG
jgi:translation initiation factor 1 (eIF-1/SUI1)